MKKLNKYLFYALALFPILDFAVLNIITILFFVTTPFNLKGISNINKKQVFFVAFLITLTIIPALSDLSQCSIIYWLEKVIPLYITSILLLFVSPYITNEDYKWFRNIYVIGVIIYILRFIIIVLTEANNSELIVKKNTLFFSDIMNLLGPEIDVLSSNYHKPYFSLIVLLALFFSTKKFIEEKRELINFSLILFFLAVIVFPMSLPNIVLVFAYLFYFVFLLFKKKRFIISTFLLVCVTSSTVFLVYKSFKNNNLDITEDIGFITELIKGKEKTSPVVNSNPREIIYSALLNKLEDVPVLGYGYCNGKETVTNTIEDRINGKTSKSIKNNLLLDTEKMESYLWKKNGIQIENKNNSFYISSIYNKCQSHTLYQIITDLEIDEVYTFSISVKSGQNKVVLRLGELENQMVVYDLSKNQFSHIGKDILNKGVKAESNDFYRISLSTKIKNLKNITLIGFYGKNNSYNHCYENETLIIKQPKLELGLIETGYSIGFSKNEKNILGSKINAHNIFLQEYYLGGIVGLISIVLLYGWFLFLAKIRDDKLLFFYLLAVIFNSLFENIQYRQIGISIIIISSILLIFKKNE